MADIVPRWEWRTFGERFGDAESRFAALEAERVQDSDELYLLARATDANVKIRDDLLDVKRLEQVNEDGLEQWLPVLKAPFPVSAADARSVLEELGVESPAVSREEYTLEQLLEELVRPDDRLLAVRVRKHRSRYTIGGCPAELTDLETDAGPTRTVAVESEDPDRVVAAVGELGLGSVGNVSFPRGLKTLAGFGARRFAVIDVGTNSVKFHVGERLADGSWRTVVDRSDVTRLGEGLDQTGRLSPDATERTVEAIAAMAEEARSEAVESIAAVGTAGLRIAANSADFLAAVRARSGVEIEVISGEEESRLAYLAVTQGIRLGEGSLAVFDTGGGSSQFTFGHGGQVEERFSVNVGAVRLTEQFHLDGVVSEADLGAALAAIGGELERLDDRQTPDVLVGLGGAVTNMAAVKHALAEYDPDVVQGTVLDRTEVDRQIELYRTRSADERRSIPGLQPKRAEVILAGACVVRTVLAKLGDDALTVSDRGLRHGVLLERFGERS